MELLRLVGIGAVAVVQEWIPIAIAAAAGRHRLTLRQGVKAAASHRGRDVLAAILSRRRSRCRGEGDKRQRKQRGRRRGGHFQKLFHVGLPMLASSLKPTWDGREPGAI